VKRYAREYGGVAALAAILLASVWPILRAHSIPAFQQDWLWPLSRPLALRWLQGFAGLWDGRAFGSPNLLAWQTYVVVVQVALVLAFGSVYGLAIWIVALEGVAAASLIAMLREFGIRSRLALYGAAALYAFGPVAFTRLQAGHLAYLAAYALLPLCVYLASSLATNPQRRTVILLGLAFGLACSQIQFAVIVPLAVAAALPCMPRGRRIARGFATAAAIGVAVQLQAYLPLLLGAAARVYESKPPLLRWETNLSAPPLQAAVLLGYFPHYYETHAPGWIAVVVAALLASALAIAFARRRRLFACAAILWVVGALLVSGLDGLLSAPLAWAFSHLTFAGIFRDLNYFSALTSLGICLAVATAIDAFPPAAAAYLPMVAAIVAPMALGAGIAGIVVPTAWIDDTLSDARIIAAHGPGRVLWLPSGEQIGPLRASNSGRDIASYEQPSNEAVAPVNSRELAYAVALLRAGRPQWSRFALLGVRYAVVRAYLQQAPASQDARIPAGMLEGARRIAHSAYSDVYELPQAATQTNVRLARPDAMLFSELRGDANAVLASNAVGPALPVSVQSDDPRAGWISSALSSSAPPMLADSIYPYVWTLSPQPLAFVVPDGARCVFAASTGGATLEYAGRTSIVRGFWKRYDIGGASSPSRAVVRPRGLTAIARQPCDALSRTVPRVVVMTQTTYDPTWRAIGPHSFDAPLLANGWATAWSLARAASPRVYLPAVAQALGFLIGALTLAFAFLYRRREEAAPGKDRSRLA
jgi:hypothetical protein